MTLKMVRRIYFELSEDDESDAAILRTMDAMRERLNASCPHMEHLDSGLCKMLMDAACSDPGIGLETYLDGFESGVLKDANDDVTRLMSKLEVKARRAG